MTDIVEEARAMLAQATPGPWFISGNEIASDRGVVAREPALGNIRAPGGRGDAALIAAAPRLLAAFADECERLRAENKRHAEFRASINEVLPRQFGVTVFGAIEELHSENARLWEAMPSESDRDALHECIDAARDLGIVGDLVHVAARAVSRLARLDAAKGVR